MTNKSHMTYTTYLKKIKKPLLFFLALLVLGVAVFFFFNKKTEAAWWNDQWLYRKALVINQTYVTADLTDFPVLVSHTDSGYATKIQTDADDIVFTDNLGNILSHEIESYNSGTGALVAWVKIPALDGDNNSTIYMYYGNASVGSQQAAKDVWSNQFFAVWHMGESSGTVYDSTGNGYGLAAYNTPTYAQTCKVGKCLLFDNAQTEYLQLDQPIDIATPFTITAWFYDDEGTTDDRNIVQLGDKDVADQYYRLAPSDTTSRRICNAISTGTFYCAMTTTAYTTSSWNYASAVFTSATDRSGYLNAAGKGTNTTSAAPTGIDRINIGYEGDSTPGDPWSGYLDEVRISRTARSENWMTTEYNNQNSPASFFSVQTEEKSPGPIGYWSFDEGYGATAQDSSSGNNDGTITNAVWKPESECVSGKCLYFDGSGDYVTTSDFFYKDVFSVCAWAKTGTTGAGTRKTIAAKRNSSGVTAGQDEWELYTEDGYFSFASWNSSDSLALYIADSSTYQANTWYYVCGVQNGNGNTGYLYVNGVQKNSAQQTSAMRDGSALIQMGVRIANNDARYWNGFIDEAKIFPYARTADQVKQDYNAGLAGAKSASGTSASFGGQSDKWLTDGLVGYWKMDETAGAWDADSTADDAIDSSGNGKTGSAYGDADSAANMKFGNAGNFDGSGDYLAFSSYDFGYTFTISAWIKPDNVSHIETILANTSSGCSANGFKFFINEWNNNDGHVRVEAGNGSSCSEAFTLDGAVTFSQWNHVVAVVDSSNSKTTIYVNGVDSTSEDYMVYDFATSGTWRMGSFTDSNFYFDGNIDDLRVYNRALSADEVSKLYNWAPGPVGHWKMDEKVSGNAQTLYDSSGYEKNATTNDGANDTGMSCAVQGRFGSACNFDGTDDYATAASAGSGIFSSTSTLSVWLKADDPSASGWHGAVTQGRNDAGFWWLGLYGGNWQFYSDGTPDRSLTSSSVTAGAWYHVEIVQDASYTIMYVNGIVADYDSVASTGNSYNLYFGNTENYTEYFDGQIDDVKIYNYARTQKQVVEDMNAGHPAGGSPIASQLGYWNFDEGFGDTAYDKGYGGNGGTLQSGSSGTNDTNAKMWDKRGKFGGAMEFDGTNDYVNTYDNDSVEDLYEMTVSAWIFPTTLDSTERSVIAKHHDTASLRAYIVRTDTSNRIVFCVGTGSASPVCANSETILQTNHWYHVVGRYDGTYLKMYINGLIDGAPVSQTGAINSNTNPVIIGARYKLAYETFFAGLIDEVKIYSSALTEDEIKIDYALGAAAVIGEDASRNNNGTAVTGQAKDYCIPGDTSPCAGPVGEWKMDEKVAGDAQTIYDTSGNGNNGTTNDGGNNTGMSCAKPGKYGTACNFDGTDDYVSVGSGSTLAVNDNVTVSVWIKPNSSNAAFYERIVTTSASYNPDSYALAYEPSSNTVMAGFGGSDPTDQYTYGSATIVPENVWSHIAMTASGTGGQTVKIYVNGIEETNSTQNSNSITTDTGTGVYLGIRHNLSADNAFNGSIDDVKIYNYARTPAQIAWDFNRGKAIAEWKFDECQGNIAYDSSGNGNNGTITIGGTGTQDALGVCSGGDSGDAWYNGRVGKNNSAMSLDGTSDYVSLSWVDTPYSFGGSSTCSLSGWFKVSSSVSQEGMIYHERNSSGNATNMLQMNDEGVGGVLTWSQIDDANTRFNLSHSGGLNDNQWHYFAIIKNGTNVKMYIDGALKNESNSFSFGAMTFNSRTIGSSSGTGQFFTGLLDDIRINDNALTPLQIKTEFANGSVSFR